MERRRPGDRNIGSVKAAINMYGERILESTPALRNTQKNFPENSSSRAKELLLAKRDITRHRESRRNAESARAEAETELSEARSKVKNLKTLIEVSSSNVKSQLREFDKGTRPQALQSGRKSEKSRYEEVTRELEHVKLELSKLKLDVASVLEEKLRVQKEAEASSSKMRSSMSSAEALRKEIEEVGEEQVLVELAQIEALKEHAVIEAEREKELSEYSNKVEETKQKMNHVREEIENSKELGAKLAVTLSDVYVLQNELKLVRDMDKRVPMDNGFHHPEDGIEKGEEDETSVMLRAVTEELEEAKKELATIKEEGFQFMSSMDIIRNELRFVAEERARLKIAEEKTELTVQSLNSKLLRAKSKLEATTAAEEKAKSIVSNLSLTLEQLRTEAEAAKKEKELIFEETEEIKEEIQKTEGEIDLTDERLQAAMQELVTVKASEAQALENLGTLIENTLRERATVSQHSSSITISKFEYDYLTGRATGAEEIADKKVAAAQAWIEALKASEREILMKSELVHRKGREMRVEEEQQVYRMERSLSAKRRVEGEITNWRQKRDKISGSENAQLALPRKSPRKLRVDNADFSPARRAKFRKSSSPGTRLLTRSPSIALKKRKKVMPNLTKIFSGGDTKRKSKVLQA
ncbi:protein PLASTID MOVEMENT IMPAIRED 2 [Syzygium oleosum]|uniref:protein PLASTID MOVEMENT IMPAIRED 2 n=1 Tax=Syzygium oleosum TaxID=219896 RepID=UPI0024BB6A2B|nr:protein PLASTID MOVEMENT IMPAIRED 2 [Syzygium oleosum]XP_030461172.2 protein PLASTID MOVEMENT IMPAIRED 2 [Syzygium oleosum]XP_056162815.1 protein PLASTID MOVEMENT IMPAIRED 2 [Syzygium oleosum]